jgi:hypothetical protein
MSEELAVVACIEWISSGFGGEGHYLRPWLRCPRETCGRRVAIFYSRTGSEELPKWACRMCLNLCYPVELEDRVGRLLRKWRKARAKFGDGRTKAKRMRHRTFARLGREYLKIQHELSEARHKRILRTLVRPLEFPRRLWTVTNAIYFHPNCTANFAQRLSEKVPERRSWGVLRCQ